MCCCLSGEPIESDNNKINVRMTEQMFQTTMLSAPCAGGNACCWFFGQCIPCTCCCTQCMLRRKVLDYDMSKYVCCQGYLNCCCFKAGSCGEETCPDLCLCLESLLCNSCAVSASRLYVMDKYQLSSDPCDYRIIRFSNCMQILSCICHLLAMFIDGLQEIACIIDRLADLVYQIVSGCMTAQTAFEVDYQIAKGNHGTSGAAPIQATGQPYGSGGQQQYGGQQPQQGYVQGYATSSDGKQKIQY